MFNLTGNHMEWHRIKRTEQWSEAHVAGDQSKIQSEILKPVAQFGVR